VLACVLLAYPGAEGVIAQAAPEIGAADSTQAESVEGPRRHQRRQKRPIQLGSSGGSIEDFTPIPPDVACCGGTLGALLMKQDRYFILSNNHVLARLNQAEIGEDIAQPGLNDSRCEASAGDLVGTLSGFQKLKLAGNNRSDAAIAETSPDHVSPDGRILGIGVPGNTAVNPRVGLPVVKSGRTTGVTRGEVSAVNVSGFVAFSEPCGSEEEVEVRFAKVFLVESTEGKDFSNSGDSGSVIYEDTGECPPAVGLLFAGTDAFTAANPMKIVLRHAKKMAPKGPAELVGCDPVAAAGASFTETRATRAELRAIRTQARLEDAVLAVPGVVAMGLGRGERRPDDVVFRVFVEDARPETQEALPKSLEGVPVEVVVSGKLRALDCPGAKGSGEVAGGLAPAMQASSER
jgi:hypothetical protein